MACEQTSRLKANSDQEKKSAPAANRGALISFPKSQTRSIAKLAGFNNKSRDFMPNVAHAVKLDIVTDDEIIFKIDRLLWRAALAFSSAGVIDQDSEGSADHVAYAKQLALTGLDKFTSAIRAYAATPEYAEACRAGPDGAFPIFDNPAVQDRLADLAREIRLCAVLGPASDNISREITRLLECRHPADIDGVAVHCDAAEQWLRARPAKSARR
jgi:hypothetical protein